MKQTTRITIANLLTAAGAVLTALATEFGGTTTTEETPTETPAAKPKKTPKVAAAAAEKPAEPEPGEISQEEPAGGKSYEDLRAMIEPLVKGGQGEDVKKVIAKYGANLKDIATKPETHAAFEKDLAALSY